MHDTKGISKATENTLSTAAGDAAYSALNRQRQSRANIHSNVLVPLVTKKKAILVKCASPHFRQFTSCGFNLPLSPLVLEA